MPANERIILGKMIRYCDDAVKYAQDISYDDFTADELYLTFSIFALSQLGEHANRLERSFFQTHPELPWMALRGIRNRIVHDYEGVQFRVLWDVIQNDIPKFKLQLESILAQLIDSQND